MSSFYTFGGLTVKTDAPFHADGLYHLSFYKAEPTENPDVIFTVHTNCENIPEPEGTFIAEVNKRYWYKTQNGYAFFDKIEALTDKILNLMVADETFSHIELYLCPTELLQIKNDERPYHLTQEILRYVFLFHEGTIIHASSLAYDGKGLLFSAPSGTGKSTHTNLWTKFVPGTEIVNDDMPIVRLENGIPYLYGAPWSGKNSIHKNIRVPLNAVVFIERNTTSSLSPMDSMEGVWKLIEAIRKPVVPALAEKNLDIIGKIIEALPVYRLQCDISPEAVKASMQALE
ncbi:MAG: hypothetical protein E7403_06380 [Ruminococcaceae bacterium]|nr:hypothetical protein [Oscillospiraceae bacterium]